MVRSCCSVGCTNRDTAENRKKNITFHLIPKDPVLRKLWLIAINRSGPDGKHLWEPSSTQAICSQHFQIDDFMISRHAGNKLLKKNKVPSIFSWKKIKTSTDIKIARQSSTSRRARAVEVPQSTVTEERSHSNSFTSRRAGDVEVQQEVQPSTITESEERLHSNSSTSKKARIEKVPQSTITAERSNYNVILEHNYNHDPNTMKDKLVEATSRLESTVHQLALTRRREKRAKLVISTLLNELQGEKKLSEKAQQMINSYNSFYKSRSLPATDK